MPHKSPEPRDPWIVRIVWLCIGVTIYAGLTAFIVKGVRTVIAAWGVGA
jgi:hypothetical protein